jgi:hypothetical protein
LRQTLYVLAILCAIFFVATSVLILPLFNIERKAFDSETYKQAFEDQGLYERMPALLASTLQTYVSQNLSAFPFLGELTVEDWQSTISSLLPPEELRALADGALDSTFEYVNSRSNTVVISLLPIKARLVGESGVDVIRQFLKTQPSCTIDQLTQMALGLLGGSVALCNPPEEAIGLFEPFIQSQLQTLNAAFPNEVTVFTGPESGTPNDPRTRLQLVRSAVRFSPFVPILLLLAVALFAVRSLRDFLVWWGWPLLIAGAISAVLGLVGSPLVGWFLQFLIQRQGAAFIPPLLAPIIGETASAVASQMLIPVAVQGFVMAMIGLGMAVIGILVGRRTTYPVA